MNNSEVGSIYEEAVMLYFEVLSQHLRRAAKENHETFSRFTRRAVKLIQNFKTNN
jgi:hypothetical protein